MPIYKTAAGIAETRDEYQTYYADRTASWSARDGVVQGELKAVVGKTGHILDVGAGRGAFLASLEKEGYANLYGADLENYLTDIDRVALKGFSETNISEEKLAFADGAMDAVTAIALLEHIENAFHFARECARVLRPQGYLFVTLPNIYNLKSRSRFLFGGGLDGYPRHNDHIMVLPKEVFAKCFYDFFEPVKVIYGNAFIKIPLIGKKWRHVPPSLFGNKLLYVLKKK